MVMGEETSPLYIEIGSIHPGRESEAKWVKRKTAVYSNLL